MGEHLSMLKNIDPVILFIVNTLVSLLIMFGLIFYLPSNNFGLNGEQIGIMVTLIFFISLAPSSILFIKSRMQLMKNYPKLKEDWKSRYLTMLKEMKTKDKITIIFDFIFAIFAFIITNSYFGGMSYLIFLSAISPSAFIMRKYYKKYIPEYSQVYDQYLQDTGYLPPTKQDVKVLKWGVLIIVAVTTIVLLGIYFTFYFRI